MLKNFSNLIIVVISAFIFFSCSENDIVPPETETLLYEKTGLVDSAVVYGCYSYTLRHIVEDTLMLDGYSKIKVEFDGNTNSDGTISFIYLHTESSPNINVYEVHDLVEINNMHNFTVNKPGNKTVAEVRLYINPPVCGTNDFKFNSARNLRIYGVK